jgi:hypothetical protein
MVRQRNNSSSPPPMLLSRNKRNRDLLILRCGQWRRYLLQIVEFSPNCKKFNMQSSPIKFWDWACKKLSEHPFPESSTIYLSRDIKSVTELYGQRLYKNETFIVLAARASDLYIRFMLLEKLKEHVRPTLRSQVFRRSNIWESPLWGISNALLVARGCLYYSSCQLERY